MDKLFENTSIKRAYFILALPVVMSMAVTIIYNMVDTFFVAKTGNPTLVAGVSQGAPIFTLMIAIGDIFGLGGSSVISRLFGERRDKTARYISGYCFYASITCGLVVTALMFIFQAMIASITGTGINVVLNPIFIFTCGLGAAGSALATVVSNVIADVLMVYYLRTKSKKLTTSIHETKISGKLQREIYAIGIPASVTNIMVTFATALTNRYLIAYGTNSVAAMGIAMKVNTVIVMVIVGFAFGAQPLIGYTYGARDERRFRETLRFDLGVVAGLALVLTVLVMVFAPQIIRLFMRDPEIVREGTGMLRWLASSTTIAGIIMVLTTTFQSMGKATPAFWLSFSRQGLIFLIAIVLLSYFFGYTGVLAAQACADVLTLVLAAFLYHKYQPHFKK